MLKTEVGVYLGYSTTTEAPKADESAASGAGADVGTTTGTGVIVLTGVLSGVAGVFIGVILTSVRRKKTDCYLSLRFSGSVCLM